MFFMAMKFIHYKGIDNNPKPYCDNFGIKPDVLFSTIFWFIITRKLIFNFIIVIIYLALCDDAFNTLSLTTVRRVFQVKNSGPVKCTALRWKKEWLKRPVFCVGDDVVRYYKLRDNLKR
ncbi:hypothetical protein PG994_002494 [Apiospora phragmitis]|uniref:Uncharacterized protein n=1 Tax=Apiospora phragmitis TaxID=2905665 RepID=A0ABR1W5I2_9PEZI